MNENLEAWIAECVGKGTFASRADAIEFCVGATKTFCESGKITQESLKADQQKALEQKTITRMFITFPLKWSEEIERGLRNEYAGGEADLKKTSDFARPYLPPRTTEPRS